MIKFIANGNNPYSEKPYKIQGNQDFQNREKFISKSRVGMIYSFRDNSSRITSKKITFRDV